MACERDSTFSSVILSLHCERFTIIAGNCPVFRGETYFQTFREQLTSPLIAQLQSPINLGAADSVDFCSVSKLQLISHSLEKQPFCEYLSNRYFSLFAESSSKSLCAERCNPGATSCPKLSGLGSRCRKYLRFSAGKVSKRMPNASPFSHRI